MGRRGGQKGKANITDSSLSQPLAKPRLFVLAKSMSLCCLMAKPLMATQLAHDPPEGSGHSVLATCQKVMTGGSLWLY